MASAVRVLLNVGAILAFLYGIATATFAVIDGYMVTVGGVPPGEPMYLDTLAYPVRDAVFQGLIGSGAIAVGFIARVYARRQHRADS